VSAHEAVEALRNLGLPNYEARVFVALQRLGDGSAKEVAAVSDVPRSQVYGAADDLAERGLVEVVEGSPKRYRPVDLETARRYLESRLDRERDRAMENLRSVQREADEPSGVGDVATLRGRQPIGHRAAELVGDATESVILVAAADLGLSDRVADALRERATANVRVTVVTDDPAVSDRFADDPVRVIVPDRVADDDASFNGRTLLVDDDTVLLAVPTDVGDEPLDQMAMWTTGTSIGRILGRYVHAGMAAGVDDDEWDEAG
jgi:sugar-specific transcriptional regulator TrmB